MPRKPTPYFQVFAAELLTDEKVEELSHTELGILVRLWAKMWINGVERGTLLRERNVPISNAKIADFLKLTPAEWLKLRSRFVDEVKVLKSGRCQELYSKRLRKYRTKWELYHQQNDTKKKPKRQQTDKNSTTASASASASASAVKEQTKQRTHRSVSSTPTLKITDRKDPQLIGALIDEVMTSKPPSFKDFTDDIQRVCRVFIRHRKAVFGEQFNSDKAELNKIFGAMCNLSLYQRLRKPKDEVENITPPDKIIKIIERLKTKPRKSAMRYLEWAVQHQSEVLLA